jgi:hypothetical protein
MSFMIQFQGICTHFQSPETTPMHRVVLVRWDGGTLDGHEIEEHIALLTLPPNAAMPLSLSGLLEPHHSERYGPSYRIRGARLIANSPGSGSTPPVLPEQPAYLPSLSDPTHRPRADRSTLDFTPAVVTGSEAACHFDLSNGMLYAPVVAHGTKPPANPVPYNVAGTSISVANLTDPEVILGTIEGLDSKTVIVSNECPHKTNCSEWGFLVHYKTTALFPSLVEGTNGPVFLYAAGPGCSNAQFP